MIESEVIESASSRTKDDSFDMLEDEFEKHLSQDLEEFKEGDIVEARIRMIKKSGVLVDLIINQMVLFQLMNYHNQFNLNWKKARINAMIQKLETKEGTPYCQSQARAELIWDELFDIMNRKEVVEVQIKKVTNKGYTVIFDEVTGFLHQEEGDSFTEKDHVQAIIIQVDKRRKKVMFSSRNIHSLMLKKEEVQKFFETVAVGDVLKGTVVALRSLVFLLI